MHSRVQVERGDAGLPTRSTSGGEAWMIAWAKMGNAWDTARSRAALSTGQLLTCLFLPLPQHTVWFQLQGDINISRLSTGKDLF